MSLPSTERAKFVTNYTRVLINTWSDEAYATKLTTQPRTALAEAGIELPAAADVEVIRPEADVQADEQGGVDAQVELYEKGLRSGHFQFYVPTAPQIDTTELDASELHGVAAGGVWDPYCCSCCPSCCSASGG